MSVCRMSRLVRPWRCGQWRAGQARATGGRAFPKGIKREIRENYPKIYRELGLFQFPFNRSNLEQRLDPPVEFLKRCHAYDFLAIDEESRRRIDAQFGGSNALGNDLCEQHVVL